MPKTFKGTHCVVTSLLFIFIHFICCCGPLCHLSEPSVAPTSQRVSRPQLETPLRHRESSSAFSKLQPPPHTDTHARASLFLKHIFSPPCSEAHSRLSCLQTRQPLHGVRSLVSLMSRPVIFSEQLGFPASCVVPTHLSPETQRGA